MYKFEKLNFNMPNINDAKIRALLGVARLAYKFRHQLFDDFSLICCPDFFKKIFNLIENSSPHFWVIRTKKTNEFAGFAYFYDTIENAGGKLYCASVTTCFKKEYWGKPARLAGKKFLGYCFKNFKMAKIKAECFSSNPYVIGFLQDLGFKIEGRFKKETIVRGKAVDLAVFALHTKNERIF